MSGEPTATADATAEFQSRGAALNKFLTYIHTCITAPVAPVDRLFNQALLSGNIQNLTKFTKGIRCKLAFEMQLEIETILVLIILSTIYIRAITGSASFFIPISRKFFSINMSNKT